ncbi:hypothetical protein U1Q18_039700 [Sarracenia purpurea var. burkii]
MRCHGVGSNQTLEEEPTQDQLVESGNMEVQQAQRGLAMENLEMVSQVEETRNDTTVKNPKDCMKREVRDASRSIEGVEERGHTIEKEGENTCQEGKGKETLEEEKGTGPNEEVQEAEPEI